jgi:outer membrane protein assembly factor BamB
VNSYQFGKLFSVAVDGDVYSQPLYVSNLSINGATHNILYVATEHDSLYAIDADGGTVYWQVNLIPSGGSTVDSIRMPLAVT